jgi:hypothetical protein
MGSVERVRFSDDPRVQIRSDVPAVIDHRVDGLPTRCRGLFDVDRDDAEDAVEAYRDRSWGGPFPDGEETVPIGPLELQIAYKLSLGGRTDLEDAAHLYTVFGETLSTTRLQEWVDRLDFRDRYDRLTDI